MYLCICCEGRAISKKPKLSGVSTEHSNYHRPIKPAASIQIPKYSQWIDLEELIPETFRLLFVYLALCIWLCVSVVILMVEPSLLGMFMV